MFKTLTLTTLIGAGMLGAETMQPEISALSYSRDCTEGGFVIKLKVTDALLGGADNLHGRGEIHSMTPDGKKIPWKFTMSTNDVVGTEMKYFIQAPAENLPEGAPITLGGHLDLDVFDEITYSAPVEVDFKELATSKKKFSIDGHQLALGEERFVEDGDPVYHLCHDGDKALIALEITGKDGEPDIYPFLEVDDEDWDEEGEDARGNANLDAELPDYYVEGPVRVRAVYGKGRHTAQLPVDITVDTSYGVRAEFPEGVVHTHSASKTDLRRSRYFTGSTYSIHAPEGLRFGEYRCTEYKGKELRVEGQELCVTADAFFPSQESPSPEFASVGITARWDSGTAGVIDENVTFTLPLRKAVGEPLEVTLQDTDPKEISFAGHTYTATLTLEEDDDARVVIVPSEISDEVEILVNGKRVYQTDIETEDEVAGRDHRFAYDTFLQKRDAPYTITFTRLEDAGTLTLPVHVTVKTGEPFKK